MKNNKNKETLKFLMVLYEIYQDMKLFLNLRSFMEIHVWTYRYWPTKREDTGYEVDDMKMPIEDQDISVEESHWSGQIIWPDR